MELIYPVGNENQNVDDAILPETSSTIREYFAGSSIFVTGATGFLGRLLVEKLLRTCSDLKRIYILMRPKKDKTCEKRFEEYFDNVIYDRLKEEYPKAFEKVFIISGDCALPDLGINEKDRQTIISEVNCIFHVAATVRFDEKLRIAAHINIRGTRDLLRLAKHVKNLSSIVYVSTAFSFCPQPEIDEKFYEPALPADKVLSLVEIFDDDKLEELTPTFLGKWPNTYVFTKSIAEDVVKQEGRDLPIAIVRPSIVAATFKEPLPGWIDNFYGVTGVIAGAGLGLIRTLHCKPDNLADMVPADYVINSFIAAAWDVANVKTFNINKEISSNANISNGPKGPESNISIYNYVSGPQKPFTWAECLHLGFWHGHNTNSQHQIWHPFIRLTRNKYIHLLLHFLMHIIPAYIVDFFAVCLRKKPQMVKGYSKISKFMGVISFFSTQQWLFHNQNTRELWKKMKFEDKKAFEFDLDAFDWNSYFHTYIPGIRVYVLKDPLDTLPQALSKGFKLKIVHYLIVCLLLLGFLRLLLLFWNAVF